MSIIEIFSSTVERQLRFSLTFINLRKDTVLRETIQRFKDNQLEYHKTIARQNNSISLYFFKKSHVL